MYKSIQELALLNNMKLYWNILSKSKSFLKIHINLKLPRRYLKHNSVKPRVSIHESKPKIFTSVINVCRFLVQIDLFSLCPCFGFEGFLFGILPDLKEFQEQG